MTPFLSTPDQRFLFRALCVSCFVLGFVGLYLLDHLRGRVGGVW